MSRRRKAPKRPGSPAIPQTMQVQREHLFAIVSVAACLARVIDDEFVPAAELIGRIADSVADALARKA